MTVTDDQRAAIWREDARNAATGKLLSAKDAEIARLREALFAIESKCRDCETINLIGNTREAKIAGTLRSAITIARKAREKS